MRHGYVAEAGVVALCCGVAAGAATAETIEETVRNVSASLARVPHLSDSDLLSDEHSDRYQAARRFVFENQCSSGRANPLVVTSLPLKLNLSASLGQDGRVDVAPTTPGQAERPVAVDAGRRFEIPLRISAIADFPNEYLKEMTTLLETRGLPDELASKIKKDLPQNYERLLARTQRLMNSFDPRSCPRRLAPRPHGEWHRYTIFVPPTF